MYFCKKSVLKVCKSKYRGDGRTDGRTDGQKATAIFPIISPKACTIDPIFWEAQIDPNTYQQKKNLVQND